MEPNKISLLSNGRKKWSLRGVCGGGRRACALKRFGRASVAISRDCFASLAMTPFFIYLSVFRNTALCPLRPYPLKLGVGKRRGRLDCRTIVNKGSLLIR